MLNKPTLSNLVRSLALNVTLLTSMTSIAQISSVMTNTTHSFYLKSEDVIKLGYEIFSKRFSEEYSQNNDKFIALFDKPSLNKVSHYYEGRLLLKGSVLNFKRAFWSQGELILINVSGTLNQQGFNSPEVIFNKTAMEVKAKNITIIAADMISRKLNFRQDVIALQ